MEGNSTAAQLASRRVEEYLVSRSDTFLVDNVEEDVAYQEIDVDFIWHRVNPENDTMIELKIEVKGDRKNTKNFFFETISNLEKGTPGCMLYTEADLLFYVFLNDFSLYVIKVSELKKWISDNEFKYEHKNVGTMVGDTWYTSVGIPVPIKDIVLDISGVKRIQI
jgi:hypothetical protein